MWSLIGRRALKAREAFLEHLSALQAKQGDVGKDGDYSGTIRDIIETDIVPAAVPSKQKWIPFTRSCTAISLTGALKYLGGRTAAL